METEDDRIPHWVTAAPDWYTFETPNVEVVPRLDYDFLRGVLRRLVHIPAVVQVLGENHTPSCPCPMCFAREELKREYR